MSHYTNQVQKSRFSPNIETVKSIINSKHLITTFTTLVHDEKSTRVSADQNVKQTCFVTGTWLLFGHSDLRTLHYTEKKWSQQLSPCTQSQYGLFFWSTTALKQRRYLKPFKLQDSKWRQVWHLNMVLLITMVPVKSCQIWKCHSVLIDIIQSKLSCLSEQFTLAWLFRKCIFLLWLNMLQLAVVKGFHFSSCLNSLLFDF